MTSITGPSPSVTQPELESRLWAAANSLRGPVDPADFKDAFVVQFVIAVDDEEAHRSHFLARAHENRSRASDRYLEFFDNIRKIQRYVKSLALERNVPIVHSYSLDATLAQAIELVVSRAMQAVPNGGPAKQHEASARRTHDR